MPSTASILRPSIAIAYLQLMVEILAERGIPQQQYLAGQPVDPALLGDAQARMSELQWAMLVLRAQSLTADPALGYEYGLRTRPTLHGVLGYAALTSASLDEAQQLSVRYMRAHQSRFSLQRMRQHGLARLDLIQHGHIPVARDFFIENILIGLARGICVLLGHESLDVDGLEVWFEAPQPAYYAAWRHRLPRLRFEQPCNAVCVPEAWLARKPVLADPLASHQARELCARELALSGHGEADISTRVRAELVAGDGYPSLPDIARRLGLAERSLKRRLQQEGTCYTDLLEEARRRDARQLLRHGDIDIQSVALQLGYENPANFTRAFRRWTGESPRDYRQRQATSRPPGG